MPVTRCTSLGTLMSARASPPTWEVVQDCSSSVISGPSRSVTVVPASRPVSESGGGEGVSDLACGHARSVGQPSTTDAMRSQCIKCKTLMRHDTHVSISLVAHLIKGLKCDSLYPEEQVVMIEKGLGQHQSVFTSCNVFAGICTLEYFLTVLGRGSPKLFCGVQGVCLSALIVLKYNFAKKLQRGCFQQATFGS